MTQEIIESLEKSVLCWLATSTLNGEPNVSPKEIFHWNNSHLLVANIASPNSVKNIEVNPNVSISFIDILIQKGFQLKGTATIVKKNDLHFDQLVEPLNKLTKGLYPIASIIQIDIEKAKPIIAPSYLFFPKVSLEEKIESAKKQYNLE